MVGIIAACVFVCVSERERKRESPHKTVFKILPDDIKHCRHFAQVASFEPFHVGSSNI